MVLVTLQLRTPHSKYNSVCAYDRHFVKEQNVSFSHPWTQLS